MCISTINVMQIRVRPDDFHDVRRHERVALGIFRRFLFVCVFFFSSAAPSASDRFRFVNPSCSRGFFIFIFPKTSTLTPHAHLFILRTVDRRTSLLPILQSGLERPCAVFTRRSRTRFGAAGFWP